MGCSTYSRNVAEKEGIQKELRNDPQSRTGRAEPCRLLGGAPVAEPDEKKRGQSCEYLYFFHHGDDNADLYFVSVSGAGRPAVFQLPV